MERKEAVHRVGRRRPITAGQNRDRACCPPATRTRLHNRHRIHLHAKTCDPLRLDHPDRAQPDSPPDSQVLATQRAHVWRVGRSVQTWSRASLWRRAGPAVASRPRRSAASNGAVTPALAWRLAQVQVRRRDDTAHRVSAGLHRPHCASVAVFHLAGHSSWSQRAHCRASE